MSNVKLKELIESTIKHKGTGLHICPAAAPYIRVNGMLKPLEIPPLDNTIVKSLIDEAATVEQKRTLLNTNVAAFSFSINGLGRFRACVYSQRGTRAMTVHILPFGIPTFAELRIPEDKILQYMSKQKGLILATGGTGTGKTTTLAAIVNHINETRCCHIATIEDPIEYLHRHNKSIVTQKEIGADILDIQTALRWATKSDPDIIMLNEMPHDESALKLVLSIAEEKLVLSGVTTTEPRKVINRLIEISGNSSLHQRMLSVLESVIHHDIQPCNDEANGTQCRTILIFGRKEIASCPS